MRRRLIWNIGLIVVVMFFIPLIVVKFAGSAGMVVCFVMFFAINPLLSVFIGISSGKDIRKRWYLPLVNSLVFLISAWTIFDMGEIAFVWYSLVYLLIGYIVMIITTLIYKAPESDEIKKAKLFNYIVFALVIIILIILVSCFCVYKYNRTFTSEKWLKNEWERHKIVNDMLNKNEIVGMSEREIIRLLGKETENAPTTFKNYRGHYPDENHLTYLLGASYVDGEWLTITIENGIATKYIIGVT